MAPDPANNSLWVATTSSNLHRWQLDAPPKLSPDAQPRHFVAAHSALQRSRQVFGPTGVCLHLLSPAFVAQNDKAGFQAIH